jgi:hypothetical protein
MRESTSSVAHHLGPRKQVRWLRLRNVAERQRPHGTLATHAAGQLGPALATPAPERRLSPGAAETVDAGLIHPAEDGGYVSLHLPG